MPLFTLSANSINSPVLISFGSFILLIIKMEDIKMNFNGTTCRTEVLEVHEPAGRSSTRLCGSLKFKERNKWSDTKDAIIDTGAPTSLICRTESSSYMRNPERISHSPYSIWNRLDVEILTDYEIKGVVPKKGCSLPVQIGRLKCILLDKGGNQTNEIETMAYLPETSEVPLILGFKKLLENFRLTFDYTADEAWIEEKEG